MSGKRSVVPSYVRPPARRMFGMGAPLWTAIIVIAALALIEGYARSGNVSNLELVPVTEMVVRAGELLGNQDFVTLDLLRTLGAIAASFMLSSILGVSTAYIMARSSWCRRALQPYLNVFYALPIFALYPVLVVMFGTGVLPIILLGTAFSIVVIISNSFVGFTSVPRIVENLSKSLDLTPRQHLRLVLLPSALPDILAGLKLGLAYSIIAVLASEFILSTHGLGHVVSNAYNSFNAVDMYAGVLFISAFALLANLILGGTLSRFDWRRR